MYRSGRETVRSQTQESVFRPVRHQSSRRTVSPFRGKTRRGQTKTDEESWVSTRVVLEDLGGRVDGL